jgi:putative ABC transport system substrate-binding protein
VKRRAFITLLGGAAMWPLAAHAQQGQRMRRIGIVTIQPRTAPMYAAFDQRLRELGYVEGQNLALDYVNPERQAGDAAGAIEQLLRRKVDVILATYESTLKAALAASVTVPIVMMAVDYDPLALGYVKSLARPGGNVTGLYLQQLDLAEKRVELLTQALPSVRAVTVFWDASSEDQWKATSSAATRFGLAIGISRAPRLGVE